MPTGQQDAPLKHDITSHLRYDLKLVDDLASYREKVVIDRSPGTGGWVQRAANQAKPVTEIADVGSKQTALADQQNVRTHMSVSMSGIDHFGSDIGGLRREMPNTDLNALYPQWFASSSWFGPATGGSRLGASGTLTAGQTRSRSGNGRESGGGASEEERRGETCAHRLFTSVNSRGLAMHVRQTMRLAPGEDRQPLVSNGERRLPPARGAPTLVFMKPSRHEDLVVGLCHSDGSCCPTVS